MTTIENFIINEGFLILCLNTNIEIIEPKVPPIKVEKSSAFSDTRDTFCEFFKACSLS